MEILRDTPEGSATPPRKGRILVIRGGAIGDFILTLPAIRMLREAFPETHLEILGYRHILSLAEGRFYADATRSIEYGPLSALFNPKSEIDPELAAYFCSFQQVISYIFDPDGLFATGLQRAGAKNIISISPKIDDSQHAASQLALPLETLALFLESPAAELFPSGEDHSHAESVLHPLTAPYVAIHPGSGSEKKNWPIEKWLELAQQLATNSQVGRLLVLGGESDAERLRPLKAILPSRKAVFLESLPLPVLAAVLSRCRLYLGHDTGISHLAAAAGTRCLLLFGPTDPAIWAPANRTVEVVRAPDGELSALEVPTILGKVKELLRDA